MIYHDINSYIAAKEAYANTRWKLNKDGAFAFIDGEWITEEAYNKTHSRPVFEIAVLENPDGTHISSGIRPNRQK